MIRRGRLAVEHIGPYELRIRTLMRRLEARMLHGVIVPTNPTLEGDATAVYLARVIEPLGATVTRLALGLSRGSDLEYADRVTLAEALAGRRRLEHASQRGAASVWPGF